MATQLAAPFPEFPSDAMLREGPLEGAIEPSQSVAKSVKAGNVIIAAAASSSSSSKTKTSTTTVLVYCLRRPGCILCRATALRLAALAPKLETELGVPIICVANAWMPAEIDAFVKDFWRAPLKVYLDETKALFTALGNGTLRKGSLLAFINPFSRVWANAKEAKKTVTEHNLIGDGLLLGGLLAVTTSEKQGGKLEIFGGFQETTFGDAPTDEQVMELARKAVEGAR